MSKFVLVKFNDGDYRVYAKRVANKRKLKEYANHAHIKPEAVAENTDKDALIAMARIAREEFVNDWPEESELVDRADAKEFP